MVRGVQAQLSGGQLIVAVADTSARDHQWALRLPAHVDKQIRRLRGLAVSLMTKAFPPRLGFDELPSGFADPEALIGWVPLARRRARLLGAGGEQARSGRQDTQPEEA
jgi:hypothetical protein